MHVFSDSLMTPADPDRDPSFSATDIEFVRWLKNELFLHANQMCLVISRLQLEHAGLGSNCELADLNHYSSEARNTLQFASCSFNRVYTHRAIGNLPDVEYLSELLRILQPGGVVVAASYQQDFAFAPLPSGAEVHLLRRVLTSAGFVDLRAEHKADGFIAVSARRKL